MAEKFKLKLDSGVIYSNEVPENTEVLELDCRVIGERAFNARDALKTVILKNTEVIADEAFLNCRDLSTVVLPDTVREIGSGAFARTRIDRLVIPKGVVKLGWNVIDRGVLEIYLDNKLAPFYDRVVHIAQNTRIIARSIDTEEILCEFISVKFIEDVLTKDGIDFTNYDQKLLDILRSKKFSDFDMELEAAHTRLKNPAYMSADDAETLNKLFREAVEFIFDSMTTDKNLLFNIDRIKNFQYYDYIGSGKIINIISSHAKWMKPDTIKTLLTILIEKNDEPDISCAENLMAVIDISAQLGMTEITAQLMQKLHNTGYNGVFELDLKLDDLDDLEDPDTGT